MSFLLKTKKWKWSRYEAETRAEHIDSALRTSAFNRLTENLAYT